MQAIAIQHQPCTPGQIAEYVVRVNEAAAGRKIRYAVYFNEGNGFYFANHLSSDGSTATTMLVCREDDHETCVRKLHDLEVHKPEFRPHCRDVRNVLPSFPSIPELICWSDYRQRCLGEVIDEYGNVENKWFEYITSATAWRFCNAGTMGAFVDDWVESYNLDRFPEAFIWEFIYRIGSALFYAHRNRLVHQDVYHHNIVLDWPDFATLPVANLIDFGQALVFPGAPGWDFQNPVQASAWNSFGSTMFDDNNSVIGGTLSQDERDGLDRWYNAAVGDLKSVVLLAEDIMLRSKTKQRQTAGDQDEFAFTYLDNAVQQGQGVEGYSLLLTQTIANLITLMRSPQNPILLHHSFENFLNNHVQPYIAASRAAFDANPNEVTRIDNWFEHYRQSKRMPPLLWKRPSLIYREIGNGNARYDRFDAAAGAAKGEDVFGPYRDWEGNAPLVDLDHNDLNGEISLRIDQFWIAEGLWDEATQTFEFIRYVDGDDNLVLALADDDDDSDDAHDHGNDNDGNDDDDHHMNNADNLDDVQDEIKDEDNDANTAFSASGPT